MITSAPWVAYPEILKQETEQWNFRVPNINDGNDIFELIANCPPLDVNSSYCNFLQSFHFRQTCVLAEYNGKLAGFISGYLKPDNHAELFVWQVAVAPEHRGKGLAFQMLKELLMRDNLQHIEAVETTITKDNQGSWNLFKKLDRTLGKQGSVTTFLDETKHFQGQHDTEYLYHIPLATSL